MREKELFMKEFCRSCDVSNVYCVSKCDVARYTEKHYERCVENYKNNGSNMIKTFNAVESYLKANA